MLRPCIKTDRADSFVISTLQASYYPKIIPFDMLKCELWRFCRLLISCAICSGF